MTINLKMPDIRELKPRITVFGCGGGGGNAVNNMINIGLEGVEFVVANTDAQALLSSRANRLIQMGAKVTEGLGAGSQPEVGRAAAEECIDDIREQLSGAHMVFITAGMGGGTGTGAAPVVARVARELGILTVGVVTKPFQFEGQRRMRFADAGIAELQRSVDTLIVIPNQNLFRIANEKTTMTDAFALADQVLHSGVACITDLMVREGLINLDFADVRAVMRDGGKAMMGTGEASGEGRAIRAAEAAIANPLLDESSMKGAKGLLISITGGEDMTLFEVDEAATRIRQEVDADANIILGATKDVSLEGIIRVSMVATGIDIVSQLQAQDNHNSFADLETKLRTQSYASAPTFRATPTLPPVMDAPKFEAPIVSAPSMVAPMRQETFVQQPVVQQPVMAQESAPHYQLMDDFLPKSQYEAPQAPSYQSPQSYAAPQYKEEPILRPLAPNRSTYQQEDMMEAPAPRVMARTMPVAQDFPQHAQSQFHEQVEVQEERRPVSLLQRLTGATMRREEHQQMEEPRRQEENRKPQPQAQVQQTRSAQVDNYGRPQQVAQKPLLEEDNYEIPAFLRRNAR